jgi:hypothetical protein
MDIARMIGENRWAAWRRRPRHEANQIRPARRRDRHRGRSGTRRLHERRRFGRDGGTEHRPGRGLDRSRIGRSGAEHGHRHQLLTLGHRSPPGGVSTRTLTAPEGPVDRRLLVIVSACIAGAAIAIGCGAPGSSIADSGRVASAMNAPSSPPPGGSGPPPSGDCIGISAGSSRMPVTIADLHSGRWVVAVATIAEHLPAYWTTADGSRPVRGFGGGVDAAIVTPLALTRIESLLGEIAGQSVVALGGSLGCDSYVNRDIAVPPVGERVVLVLMPVTDGPLDGALLPIEVWRVDASDTVLTPGEGEITLTELRSRLGVRPSAASS